jgi:hypothetical protein
MKKQRICFVLGVMVAALAAPAQASNILADSVNASLTADNGAYWGVDDVGWLYTPGSSYNLIGINTFFSIPNLTIVQDRTVTVAVFQGDRPSNGGTLLGTFAFNSSLADGHLGGGSFASPIALTAGQQYFVAFEEVGPLSPTPNVNDLGVNFTADASGTFLSFAYFDSATNGSCSTIHTFSCVDPNHDILGQPILQFFAQQATTSSTPEPGSVALLGAVAGLGLVLRLKSKWLCTTKQ